jgi:UDP-glucose:(heptosyl)LPS alpha-1,3-glucosyltransferase
MKIALAVFQINTQGGKERDCLATAQFLRERGHDVTIVTTSATDAQAASLPLAVFPRRGMSNHDRAYYFAEAVSAYRKTAKPDALLTFERTPGADFVFAADAAMGLRLSGLARWLPRGRTYLALEKAVFSDSQTHFFFLTERQRDEYASLYGFDLSRSTVLPVILHNERYVAAAAIAHENDATRTQLGAPEDAIVAISVAVKPKQKGVDRSIEAISKFPNLHLVTVGSSDKRIKDQARALGVEDRVHVVPYTANIISAISAADFLIHPARAEAAGQVIAESLLAGRPAIVSSICGYAREVDHTGAGIVLREPFKQQELVTAVSTMIAELPAMKAAAAKASGSLVQHRGAWLQLIAESIETRKNKTQ